MDDEEKYTLRCFHDFDEDLSKRELLVLKLSAMGLSNKEISGKIFRCVKQVEHDISEIIYKLKALNMKHAINIAWERGILGRGELRENH